MVSEFNLPVNHARPVCFALVPQTKRSSGLKGSTTTYQWASHAIGEGRGGEDAAEQHKPAQICDGIILQVLHTSVCSSWNRQLHVALVVSPSLKNKKQLGQKK